MTVQQKVSELTQKFADDLIALIKEDNSSKEPPRWTDEQENNSAFFKANLDKWLKDVAYKGKHVVIADQQVRGVYDTFSAAFQFAAFHYEGGRFIIQEVTDIVPISTTGLKYGV